MHEDFSDLLEQHLAGTINEAGRARLAGLLAQPEYRLLLTGHIDDAFAANKPANVTPDAETIYGRISEAIAQKGKGRKLVALKPQRKWTAWLVAASVVLLIVSAAVFLTERKGNPPAAPAYAASDVQAPSTSRATIKLADGRNVYLDSAGNGTLALQGGTSLVKNSAGEIVYRGEAVAGKTLYNTLTNPRGSKAVSLALSDGTKVWLNSESSLTYPVAFGVNSRKVELSGEAYFEVTHDAAKPFYVSKGETVVKVLGTHFNVNAYDDEEAIKVTLLEGSVQAGNGNGAVKLKPGQQTQLTQNAKPQSPHSADLDEVMAWKNGLFLLDNTDLLSLMRQVSRWYDVDIRYKGAVPQRRFEGGVSKTLPLSVLRELLTANGIRTTLEGKVLIVQP